MNKRWDIPETSVTIYRIDTNGDDHDYQDCVAGIEIREQGMLRLDLRSLRPVRVLDRHHLIIDVYLHDILTALADKVETAIQE